LNRAGRAELLQLPGVGESLAARIEEGRSRAGGFREVADLTSIRGVGPATLNRLGPWLSATGSGSESEDGQETGKPTPSAAKSASRGKAELLTGPVDVNRASESELQRLPGIGPKMARRIIDERQKKPFRSVDDLRRVSGIGAKTLERLRPFVTVGAEPFVATIER
jgi:competence protein ComEA